MGITFDRPYVKNANLKIASLAAYFASLPSVGQPGPWRVEVPAGAPYGQQLLIATAGCAQCHGATLDNMRQGAGEVNGDFEWLKKMAYEHTTAMPQHWSLLEEKPNRLRMGNYSRTRLPESVLQDIWRFMFDLGLRVRITGQLRDGVPAANGVTYTLNVENDGVRAKGLTAEDLTVTLIIPAGSTVVSATGAGYQGVRRNEQVKADVAVWQLPRLAAKEHESYTVTLSRAATAADNLRGTVRWTKPALKTVPFDTVNIAPAPLPR